MGDQVYVLNVSGKKGKAKKLLPQWTGPGVVVKKFTDFLYQVRLRGKRVNVNHDRLKNCKLDKPPAWVVRERESCGLVEEVQNEQVYCMCRGIDDGSFMIACDVCEEWFHGKCVGVTEEQGEEIDLYTCPSCRTG